MGIAQDRIETIANRLEGVFRSASTGVVMAPNRIVELGNRTALEGVEVNQRPVFKGLEQETHRPLHRRDQVGQVAGIPLQLGEGRFELSRLRVTRPLMFVTA